MIYGKDRKGGGALLQTFEKIVVIFPLTLGFAPTAWRYDQLRRLIRPAVLGLSTKALQSLHLTLPDFRLCCKRYHAYCKMLESWTGTGPPPTDIGRTMEEQWIRKVHKFNLSPMKMNQSREWFASRRSISFLALSCIVLHRFTHWPVALNFWVFSHPSHQKLGGPKPAANWVMLRVAFAKQS